MTDAAAPQAGDATEVVGSASYWFHKAEFLAERRALRLAKGWPTGFGWRLGVVLAAHLPIMIGLLGIGVAFGKGDWKVLIPATILVLPGAWIAYHWGYGRRRRIRKLFKDFPAAGLKIDLHFTQDGLSWHYARSDGRIAWELFPIAAELRDGFIVSDEGESCTWIPKHALNPPLDVPAMAAFLRSKIARYRVIPRKARPSE